MKAEKKCGLKNMKVGTAHIILLSMNEKWKNKSLFCLQSASGWENIPETEKTEEEAE